MMCEECQRLQAHIAWLEGELGIRHEDGELDAIRTAFGLKPKEVWFAMTLYRARGRPVERYWLLDNMPSFRRGTTEYPSLNMLRVYMSKVRAAMGKGVIRSVQGIGYAMTPEGIALVDAVLRGSPHADQG